MRYEVITLINATFALQAACNQMIELADSYQSTEPNRQCHDEMAHLRAIASSMVPHLRTCQEQMSQVNCYCRDPRRLRRILIAGINKYSNELWSHNRAFKPVNPDAVIGRMLCIYHTAYSLAERVLGRKYVRAVVLNRPSVWTVNVREGRVWLSLIRYDHDKASLELQLSWPRRRPGT